MRRVVLARCAGAMFTAVAIGCGGGGGDGGVTNPPPPPGPAAVASVAVTIAPSAINVGQTAQATAVLRDVQNNVLTGRTVAWESSNTGVASVSATTGLITGVGAGTVTITASSESRAGTAQVTVNLIQIAPPQISGLTITQNGQAANLAQVAGKLTLAFNLDIPAGYAGNLIVRIDTVEMFRKPVSAPLASGGALAAPLVEAQLVDVNTAHTVTNVSADEIREIPSVRNGAHILSVIVQPTVTGGQATQQQTNITTNNPIHAHGNFSYGGLTALGADGKTYTGGDGVGSVVFAIYGTEQVTGFEVTLTDIKPQYGHGAGGQIANHQRITRTDFKFFPLPAAPVERPDLTYILSKFTVNGTEKFPQVDYIGNAQFTTDPIGSGFANTLPQTQGVTLPAGMSFHLVDQLPADLLANGIRGRWGIEPINLDNVGPRQVSLANEPPFSFLDRMTTVGGAARWQNYGFGAMNGHLSSQYEFEGGFRSDRLADATGIDATRTEYYAAPISDQQNLFKLQYKIGTSISLNESSGSRSYTAGARAYDKLGNHSDWTIRTSAKNPFNVSGSSSIGASIGVDVGAFGFTQLRANLNLAAMPTDFVLNQSTVDPSLCWFWNVSNSVVGLPNGWLSVRAKKDGVWGLGAGTAFDQYQILPSTGSGTTGTATFFTGTSMQQIFSRVGGASSQGLYEWEFKAADNAGRYIGDMMYPKVFRGLYDFTVPTGAQVTYNGTVTAGQPASGTLSATDNWGLKKGFLGMRFGFSSNLFSGGQVYVPIGQIPIPAQNGTPVKSLSMPITGTAPIGFWFFNPVSGAIDMSNFYRSNGASWQVMDYAGNLSAISFWPFSNSAPIPTISNVSSVKAGMSSNNWCPGTCAAGGQNIVDLIFNFLDPLASGPPGLSKAEWYGIPANGGGIVYPLETATTLTSVVEGTGRRHSYNVQFNTNKYCGPPGPMQVFVIGYNTGYYLKVNPFFSVTVQTPAKFSNDCLKLAF